MRILCCLICLFCTKLFAQNLNVYHYGNYDAIGLTLMNDVYSLISVNPINNNYNSDDLPDKNEAPDIIWSQGTFTNRKDTVVCIDSKLHKRCWFVRDEGGDMLRLVKMEGFDYKCDILNKQKILRHEKEEFVEVCDLLNLAPVFYLILHQVLGKNGEKRMTEVFHWQNGVKKRLSRIEY